MLPFMAQGAAMAIEDAYVLAQALASAPPIHALQHYAIQRRDRTARVQAASRTNQARYHQHDTLRARAELTALGVARVVAPDAASAALDWLYGFDVTG
jgi:salicylate hydroxylase